MKVNFTGVCSSPFDPRQQTRIHADEDEESQIRVGTEYKFRSEDRVEQATLETRKMQYLYAEGDLHIHGHGEL